MHKKLSRFLLIHLVLIAVMFYLFAGRSAMAQSPQNLQGEEKRCQYLVDRLAPFFTAEKMTAANQKEIAAIFSEAWQKEDVPPLSLTNYVLRRINGYEQQHDKLKFGIHIASGGDEFEIGLLKSVKPVPANFRKRYDYLSPSQLKFKMDSQQKRMTTDGEENWPQEQ